MWGVITATAFVLMLVVTAMWPTTEGQNVGHPVYLSGDGFH
jgi:hypothetical protein